MAGFRSKFLPSPSPSRKFIPQKEDKAPKFGGYYRWREMMDKLDLWPEKRKEEWNKRNLED
jgi:hypothetical protein